MKKVIIIIVFVLFITLGTLNASGLLKVDVVSQGHMIATSDAIQINGGSAVNTTKTVTFTKIDASQAQYTPVGTYSETFTFDSKTDATVGGTLIMYKEGELWETDKFDVIYRSDNITYNNTFDITADYSKDIEVIVYLYEDLSFDEMGKEVSFTIEFEVIENG